MKPLFQFLIISLISMGFTTTSHAESWCEAKSPPSINIHTSTDDISYNYSLSKKDLDHFEISTVNPYASNVITDVGGLMKGGIETKQNLSFGTMTNYATQEICFWYDKVDIYLHIKPTIYIANDFPRGSCMFNAIMEHEQKHVLVDREIVNKYAATIGNAIQGDIARSRLFGPSPLSQKNEIQSAIGKKVQDLLNQYTTQMSDERRKRQQKIDSLEEYERINHLCPENNKQSK